MKKSKAPTTKPRIKNKNPTERAKLSDFEYELIKSWARRIKTEEYCEIKEE